MLTRTLPAKPLDEWPEEAKIAQLLDLADDGIGERLATFEREQNIGYKLNELTERYYASRPREFEDDWPNERFAEEDPKLRAFLTQHVESEPKEILKLAQSEFKIALSKD